MGFVVQCKKVRRKAYCSRRNLCVVFCFSSLLSWRLLIESVCLESPSIISIKWGNFWWIQFYWYVHALYKCIHFNNHINQFVQFNQNQVILDQSNDRHWKLKVYYLYTRLIDQPTKQTNQIVLSFAFHKLQRNATYFLFICPFIHFIRMQQF